MNDIISRTPIIESGVTYSKYANAQMQGTEYYVDIVLAKKLISFVSLLKHTGGELAGVQFQLLQFQIIFLIDVICTKKISNSKRRYTTAMLVVPRKNGKTELIGAVLNYFLFMDKEKGKEIYCAANETNQAQIIFKATESMVRQNKSLESKCTIYKSTKTIERSTEFEDFIKVLTSNADTKDGLKPYVVVYDELHAAKNPDLYTVLEEGTAHREDPLFIIISTLGYNQQGIMKQKYDYAKKVKEGIIKDDSFYSMIFEPSEEDLGEDGEGWKNEEVWKKVNPALGYGVKIEYLRNKFIKALHSGEDEVAFKTKHLNIWTNSAKAWIKNEVWAKSFKYLIDEEKLRGRKCYAGLDLASTTDIAAFVLVFEPEEPGGHYDVLCRFFIPEDNMRARAKNDKVPYITWHRDGWLIATPGNVIDYAFIEEQIKQDCEIFDVEEIAYDAWNATSLVSRLLDDDVAVIVPFRQGFKSMSGPTKEIEVLVLQERFNHGNHPVFTWMISNVAIQRDPTDAIKIDKSKSSEKVDGPVAAAMAVGRIIVHREPEEKNPYQERGMRIL